MKALPSTIASEFSKKSSLVFEGTESSDSEALALQADGTSSRPRSERS